VVPRSVSSARPAPNSDSLATTFFISHGAMNCPFFTFTTRPVRPHASSRSVWRARNAGTCSTSHTSATAAACPHSWTSVVTGRPVARFTASSVFSPSWRPGPRNDLPEVRFALSNDALKTSGSPSRSAYPLSVSAMRSVRSCPSITHGPQIHRSGRPPPTSCGPYGDGLSRQHVAPP
jgi:hypothetical protein